MHEQHSFIVNMTYMSSICYQIDELMYSIVQDVHVIFNTTSISRTIQLIFIVTFLDINIDFE